MIVVQHNVSTHQFLYRRRGKAQRAPRYSGFYDIIFVGSSYHTTHVFNLVCHPTTLFIAALIGHHATIKAEEKAVNIVDGLLVRGIIGIEEEGAVCCQKREW